MSELRDLLVVFEWLTAHDGCTVDEVRARFGLERDEVVGIVDTLAQVGFLPESPDQLLSAFIDEDDDTVHVAPFDGLDRGVSIDLETALRIDSLGSAFVELAGAGETDVTRRALERLRAALTASGIDPAVVAADLQLPGSDQVPAIAGAVADRAQLRLRYRASGGELSERVVDPVSVFLDGGWYLEAHDHLRDGRRFFKLERIVSFERTGTLVQADHVPIGALQVDAGDTAIELELSPGAGWLLEHLEGAEVRAGARGSRRVRVHGGGVAWIVPLLLAAGASVHVVEPEELRAALREAIDRTLAHYR